ncbi:MAG TPA: Stp1/IreP family PP2C-type Ser/Thr phosphatase [Polyangiaceae bacterium]|jgi:protein phosphatase|nr:Stp1/IreP family PP2C-type Ser/Thr phosphatase [Polyangiaceae bacterium]
MTTPQAHPTPHDVRFEAVGVTDIGRQRKHNEDFVLLRPELDLFVVADGMGGHNAGDVASKLATASLRNFFEALADGSSIEQSLFEGYGELADEAQRLAAAIRKANRDVFEISSHYRQHHGMGSTVVACYLAREKGVMHVGHVGDSRCYRFRDGELMQLTHDHSLVNDALALKPDLTPEELARLPKNIITRALGMREDVKVDIRSEAVKPGDIFLLCSDGLSGMVNEEGIADVLGALYMDPGSDIRESCEQLVTMANDAGGNDNITALLIRIEDLGGGDGDDDDSPVLEATAVARMNTGELEAIAAEESGESTGGLVECITCGAEVPDHNKFCTECGASLVGDE